jgi:hypothetical protein
MKKLLFLLAFLGAFVMGCYAQPVVNRSNPSHTVSDARLEAKRNLYLPKYSDTTQANVSGNIGIDSAGAIIFTYNGNKLWKRGANPKRWIEVASGASGSTTTNISVLNDSSVVICNATGACDTLIFDIDIDIYSVYFLNDSSIVVCNDVQVCDTLIIPQQELEVYQNGVVKPAEGIIEFGTNPLVHNTTLHTQ